MSNIKQGNVLSIRNIFKFKFTSVYMILDIFAHFFYFSNYLILITSFGFVTFESEEVCENVHLDTINWKLSNALNE